MSQASASTKTSNSDISPGEQAAHIRTLAARLLIYVLGEDSAFYEHAQSLAQTPVGEARDKLLKEVTDQYAPRGARKRDAIAVLLRRLVARLEQLESREMPDDDRREAALIALPGAAGIAFGNERQPGDPQRAVKQGAAHNELEALHEGARLIARRGAGLCLVPTCKSKAANGDYCRNCESHDRHLDHKRRLDRVEHVWANAVPVILRKR